MGSSAAELCVQFEDVAVDTPVFANEQLQEMAENDGGQFGAMCCTESGWAVLVHDRVVYIWLLTPQSQGHSRSLQLNLPTSGLKYNAHLILPYPTIGCSSSTSVLACSPEGLLRHWPDASVSARYNELAATELHGLVAHSLTQITPCQFLLNTTTGCVFSILIRPHARSNAERLSMQQLHMNGGGMFGAVSRRMSSMLFSSGAGERSVVRCVVVKDVVCTASTNDLHICTLPVTDPSQTPTFSWSTRMQQLITEEFTNLSERGVSAGSAQSHIVDCVCYGGNSLLLLLVCVYEGVATYALGFLDDLSVVPTEFAWFSALPLEVAPRACNIQSARLLAAPKVLAVQLPLPAALCDSSDDFTVPHVQQQYTRCTALPHNDVLLGIGSCAQHVYVCLCRQGIQSVRLLPRGFATGSGSVTVDESDRLEQLQYLSAVNQSVNDAAPLDTLRQALLLFIRKQMGEAAVLVDGLQTGPNAVSVVTMHSLLAQLAHSIIDDAPANAREQSSLHPLTDLENKRRTYELFAMFLDNMGLLKHATAHITHAGQSVLLLDVLHDCAHELSFVHALLTHADNASGLPELWLQAVQCSASLRGRDQSLSHEAVMHAFSHKVSACASVLSGLSSVLQQMPVQQQHLVRQSSQLSECCAVLLDVLHTVHERKHNVHMMLMSHEHKTHELKVHWLGADKVMDAMQQIFDVVVKMIVASGAVSQTASASVRKQLIGQCTQLGSVLIGQVYVATANHQSAQFHAVSKHVVQAMIDARLYDGAATIAQQFMMYESLLDVVALQYSHDPVAYNERINQCKLKFSNADRNFDETLAKWCLDNGKYSALFAELGRNTNPQVQVLLQDRPDLQALHHVHCDQYEKAKDSFSLLASGTQCKSMAQKKSLLSLAKLSALCSDEPIDLEDINLKLDLIRQQEALSDEQLQAAGYERATMPPLSAEQLIDTLTFSSELMDVSSVRKALRLLADLQPQSALFSQSRSLIWSRALQCTDWSQVLSEAESVPTAQLLHTASHTLFCSALTQLAKSDFPLSVIEQLMPNTDSLLAAQGLSEQLKGNAQFVRLLRVGEERLRAALVAKQQTCKEMLAQTHMDMLQAHDEIMTE